MIPLWIIKVFWLEDIIGKSLKKKTITEVNVCDAVITCSKGVAKSLEAAFAFTDYAKNSTNKNERQSSNLPVSLTWKHE